MPARDKSQALDKIVVVLFENRSLDNLLGHLYGPEDGKNFDGVIGKEPEQPDPRLGRAWRRAERRALHRRDGHGRAEPGLGGGVVPHQHAVVQRPRRAQPLQDRGSGDGAVEREATGLMPWMDGFVTDYISTFTGETGRQPTYDEYAQIMTGYTPEQSVLNGIAREFGVVRPLVLRGAVADVHEPLLLDRCHVVRAGRQQPGQ